MRLVKALLRQVQDRREERFSRRRGLVHFGDSGLIAFEPGTYSGPEVTLRSGVVVRGGAKIVDLHLDSRRTAEYYRETPVRARLRLFRDAMSSLRQAAAWLEGDPSGREVQAIRGVTVQPRKLERFGFEIMSLPLWPWIFLGIHMRWLTYLYKDEERGPHRGREPLVARLTPRQGWMSRKDFTREYGAGGTR